MGLLDNVTKVLDQTDLDEKLMAKAGIEGVDSAKVDQILKMVGKIDTDKIDLEGIAAKVGVPADVVKKVLAMAKK